MKKSGVIKKKEKRDWIRLVLDRVPPKRNLMFATTIQPLTSIVGAWSFSLILSSGQPHTSRPLSSSPCNRVQNALTVVGCPLGEPSFSTTLKLRSTPDKTKRKKKKEFYIKDKSKKKRKIRLNKLRNQDDEIDLTLQRQTIQPFSSSLSFIPDNLLW